MKIIVHSKTGCPSCVGAKQYLKNSGIAFEEIVHDDFDERNRFYDCLGLVAPRRTVPQIFEIMPDGSEVRIGGFDDLKLSDVAERARIGTINFSEEF